MYAETHKVILTKEAQRQLQTRVIESNITNLLGSVNTKSLAVRGWTIAPDVRESYRGSQAWRQKYATSGDAEYLYEMYLTVSFARDDDKRPGNHELASILRTIHARASQPAFGKWELSTVDDEAFTPTNDVPSSADMIGYAEVEIPDDWDDNFAHLFGLGSHILRIKTALEAGEMSEWRNRYHCALVGPPGCGKSDICQSIKRALGEDAVLEFDATATTAAGAIKELTEREILPRVLLVEEIEKADEKAMSFLLSVCDLRSQIRKTTARSTVQRDTKLFVIATVNDVPLFEKLQAGALASRFANKIWFKRPGRDQLKMILQREVQKIDGDEEWIDPALDYCESQGITDPRTVTAICLCGREMLITGEYQKMLQETTGTM